MLHRPTFEKAYAFLFHSATFPYTNYPLFLFLLGNDQAKQFQDFTIMQTLLKGCKANAFASIKR